MPLIVFVGISSLGALFLIMFFAELWRSESSSSGSVTSWTHKTGDHKPSTIPLCSEARPMRKPTGLVVLRRQIECSRQRLLTHVHGTSTEGEVRKI